MDQPVLLGHGVLLSRWSVWELTGHVPMARRRSSCYFVVFKSVDPVTPISLALLDERLTECMWY